ncbi:MAG: asparagine synthase-related protein [Pseudonocardiaceae bacterium]
MPGVLGDIDASLNLLFKTIRGHSTVALSGESADEIFGGYRWFHQPEVQAAETFRWIACALNDPHTRAHDPLTAELDVPSYVADRYASAVAEVEPAESEIEHERRTRVICYLHLTRFLRLLLDRKDRMRMAVCLEVRVPFCDHRLVEYVDNTPWSLKTFDGREKSLLRAAAADMLPQSVSQPMPVHPRSALRQRLAAAGQRATRHRRPSVRPGQPPLAQRRHTTGPGHHAH